MKMPFTHLPLRQKQLWFEIILDLLLLTAFIAHRYLWPAARNPAINILILSYILPIVYSTFKIHTTDDTRTDERDQAIEGRGRHAGYLLMTAGIWLILFASDGGVFPYKTALVVLWLCSRILTNSVQLRVYAGHEAWWPDTLIAALQRRRDERLKSILERRQS